MEEEKNVYVGRDREWGKGRLGGLEGMWEKLWLRVKGEKVKKVFGGGDDEDEKKEREGNDDEDEGDMVRE